MIYADSSVIVALMRPHDVRGRTIRQALQAQDRRVYYGAAQALEVRHVLRRLRGTPDGEAAWQALRASEQSVAIFEPISRSLKSSFSDAEALDSRLSGKTGCGAWDLYHIALALALKAEAFWTADQAQRDAALAAGGIQVRYFGI